MWRDRVPPADEAALVAGAPTGRAPRVLALYLPALPLQRLMRASEGSGGPVAILDEGCVACCDEEARAAGVCPGMTAAQALGALGRIRLVTIDPAGDRAALRGLAEALLALAPAVEVSLPDALLLDAGAAHLASGLGPAEAGSERAERGLLARALAVVEEMGWAAQAAVATGRASARALARYAAPRLACERRPDLPGRPRAGRQEAPVDRAPAQGLPGRLAPGAPPAGREVVLVPRGAERQALARLPLAALGLSPAVTARLAEVGISDAGGLAELPAGTLAHRFGPEGVAAARLARGEDASPLVAYVPETLPEEGLELEGPVESAEPLLFGLKRLADRVAARLAGRGLGATRLKLVLKLDPRGEERIGVPLSQPTASATRWLGPLKEHLFSLRLPGAVVGLRLTAVEVAPVAVEQLAFGDRPEAVAALETVLARLAVRLGGEALFAAEPVARYRPEGAYRTVPFPSGPRPATRRRRLAAELPAEAAHRPTRLLPTPELVVAEGEGGRITAIRVGGVDRAVLAFEGPERLAGEWWAERFDRDYYRVRLDGLGDCWIYRDGADGRLWLHGFFD
jgi:protein ImuB